MLSHRNHKMRCSLQITVILLLSLLAPACFQMVWAQEEEASELLSSRVPLATDEFLTLGTERGMGGRDFMKFDRNQIKYQIKQFIPPLLQSAFTGDAFVLPPHTFRVGLSSRTTELTGDDFFRNGDPNLAVFEEFNLKRSFVDLDLFYGFDLNRKFLHSFTLRVNVPFLSSRTNGFIHPNGQPFIDLLNAGAYQEIGDIGIFLKKKLVDQAHFPLGLAVAGAVFLPTGANDVTFGSDGFIMARRPDPDNDGVQKSFQQIIKERGGPQNFFSNLAEETGNEGWHVPAAMVQDSPRILTPFPYNDGVFGRFSPDGRMPTPVQPGTGEFSYLIGGFITRQFQPGDFGLLGRIPGRSALHLGALHQFKFASDPEMVVRADGKEVEVGPIDPGDTSTFFGSFVKPIYKDFLALDLTFVGFLQQEDSYAGKIPEPEIHEDTFEFALVDRPPFTKGFTGLLSPSLIYSPDPQLRFAISGLFRVIEPDLGPAPPFVLRFAATTTY